ncbi:MAG: hypothetical protein M3Z65_04180 [Chloroflexota bacterium]|nr:hypothetical protein [Chloroflexota bacterium]
MIGRNRDRGSEVLDEPIDLASRIGAHGLSQPQPAAPEMVRRVDGPIESERSTPSLSIQIGATETPAPRPEPSRPEPVRPLSAAHPMIIGLDEVPGKWAPVPIATSAQGALVGPAVVTLRDAPLVGEMDLVVTPLATPDDWHHFELALRRVQGVGTLRTEYYRAGILKLRLQWTGAQRFAEAVRHMPDYRVGILGEDKTTVQIRVTRSR